MEFDKQYHRQGGRCWICQRFTLPQNLTRDHIVPRADGGANNWSNYLLAHATCNEARGKLVIGSERFGRWLRKVMRGQIYKFIRRETFIHNPT